MNKEWFAVIILCALLLISAADINHLNDLMNDIIMHLDYISMYCLQEDYYSADTELSKAMILWANEKNYTAVFLRQSETDGLTNLFYELKLALKKGEPAESVIRINQLYQRCQMLFDAERLSFHSVF